jgi:hypothetical protein
MRLNAIEALKLLPCKDRENTVRTCGSAVFGLGFSGSRPYVVAVPKVLNKPSFVAPMLPSLVLDAPAGDDWIHEIKFDGYRALLVR